MTVSGPHPAAGNVAPARVPIRGWSVAAYASAGARNSCRFDFHWRCSVLAMQSTTVTVSGKGSNPKTVLYVGGLEEDVTEDVLKSAFIPFGPIKECNIPLDNETGKHRGFGFVQFEEREDAADAVDNMHNAELFGRCVFSS